MNWDGMNPQKRERAQLEAVLTQREETITKLRARVRMLAQALGEEML